MIHGYAGSASPTPEHGEISIKARLLENEWVVLIVADNGEGIPPEQMCIRDSDLSGNSLVNRARHDAKADRLVWSNVFLSAVSGRLVVALALSAGEHTVIGEIGLANLSEFVRHVTNQKDTPMVLVDGQGQILAHPDVERCVYETVPAP